MFNQSQIPSLARVLDAKLQEANIDIVPGKVTDVKTGRFIANFTLLSSEVAKLTADETFLLYLKPAVEEIGAQIIAYADNTPLYTRALPLPGKDNPVIGWRCFQGGVPVNIYIARRPTPDRHQFLIEALVQKVEAEDGEA
ncbi:MAG: hypothetical protein ACYSWO_27735 [Planctomycetota bacterium]|jgi:hypothetical protein